MYKSTQSLTLLLVFLVPLLTMPSSTMAINRLETPKPPYPAPEIGVSSPDAWLNSPPLNLSSLRGKVVLLDFWTFGCVNCTRSIPWLQSIEKKYAARDFQLIGVHTPEFDHERQRDNVVRKAKDLGRHHPIVIDNDFAIWKSYKNRYWPAFYVIDKRGVVRGVYIGETHVNDNRARAMEGLIERLLTANNP